MNTHSEISLFLQARLTLSAFFYLCITSVWLRCFCFSFACSLSASRSEENNKNNTISRASYKVSMLLHVLSSTCRGEWNRGSLHSWPRSFSSRPNKCRLLVVYCAVYILLYIESLTLTSIRLRCCHFYEHVIYINSNTCSIKTLLFFQPNEPFFLFSHAIVESKLSLHVQVF